MRGDIFITLIVAFMFSEIVRKLKSTAELVKFVGKGWS